MPHNLPLVDELLAAAPVGFALVDPDLRFVRINAALAAVHGRPPEAHMGRTVAEVLGPEGAETAAIMREVLESGRPALERELEGADGRRFLASYYPVGQPDRGPSGVGTVVLEITARSQAEAALRESRERLRIAQEAARIGTWEWEVGADRMSWSGTLGAAGDAAGAGGAPSTRSELLALVHPEDRAAVERALERTLDTGVDAEVEFRIPTTGGERWISTHARPRLDADGGRERVLGIAQDVSVRKWMELAERQARSLLDAIFENAPVGLGFLDTDLRYVRVNQALAELHGIPASRHLGQTPTEIVPALPGVVAKLSQVLGSGRPVTDWEISVDRPDAPAEGRHWLYNLYPVSEPGGQTIGVGLVLVDVTERRRTAERLTLMAAVGTLMDLPLSVDERMRRLALVLVPALGDVCLVERWEDGGVHDVAIAASDPGLAMRAGELGVAAAIDPARLDALVGSGPPVHALIMGEGQLEALARDPEHRDAFQALGARSALVLPLRSGGRPQGVIAVLALSERRRYGEADRSLAEEIGVRAALGLENARLYEDERAARRTAEQARERMVRLQSVTAELSRAAEPAGVAAALVGDGCRALAGVAAAVWRTGEEGRVSLLDADGPGTAAARATPDLALADAPPLAEALRTGASVEVPPGWGPAPVADIAANGAVAVPIAVAGGAPVGVLLVGFAAPAERSGEDSELALALGRLAAQALHRARLLGRERDDRRRAEEASKRFAFLAEVGAALDAPLGVTSASSAWRSSWSAGWRASASSTSWRRAASGAPPSPPIPRTAGGSSSAFPRPMPRARSAPWDGTGGRGSLPGCPTRCFAR